MKIKNKIHTPFGDVCVKLNNNIINFKYSEETWDYEGKQIELLLIDIDTSDMEVGDIVFCGFSDKKLTYDSGDERAEVLVREDKEIMLGLCGYEPQYHDNEDESHSYYLTEYNGYGFEYLIKREPKKYVNKFYEAKVITLAVGWVKKDDFIKANNAVSDALTGVVGGIRM